MAVSPVRHLLEIGTFVTLTNSQGEDVGFFTKSRKVAVDVSYAEGAAEIVDGVINQILDEPLDEITKYAKDKLAEAREALS